MNFLKGYRTIIFNVAVILAGLAEVADVISIVAPGSEPLVLLIVGIANLVLRYLTDTKVGESEPKTEN
jgi:hypothetical protein